MRTSTLIVILSSIAGILGVGACSQNSDEIISDRQEKILMQTVAKIGMPAIRNFRELRMANRILEERDQTLMTWTYLWSDYHRCFTFIETSVAYPLPYATQRTSPQKIYRWGSGRLAMPQADPNGLFSPESAEGTFIEMNNPTKVNQTGLVYSEPRISTFPYELPERLICSPLERPTPKAEKGVVAKALQPKKESAD